MVVVVLIIGQRLRVPDVGEVKHREFQGFASTPVNAGSRKLVG